MYFSFVKKHLIALALLFLANQVLAQKIVTLYYDKAWLLTKKDLAVYIRTAEIDTTNRFFQGTVKDETPAHQLLMTGKYERGERSGEFVTYFPNGKIQSIGTYEKGLRVGIWKYYYRNGIQVSELVFSEGGLKQALFCNDQLGKRILTDGNGHWVELYEDQAFDQWLVNEGDLENLGKKGEWTCKLEDGTLLYTEKYRGGQFVWGKASKVISQTPGYPDPMTNHLLIHYKFLPTEKFQLSKEVDYSDYPFLTPKIVKAPGIPGAGDTSAVRRYSDEEFRVVEEAAQPTGGMAAFYKAVAEIIRYPAEARKAGVQGRVFVEFIINDDGSLTDFRVLKGVGHGLDEEAIRCVAEASKKCPWLPGKQHGKPVKQRYTLPIIFRLG